MWKLWHKLFGWHYVGYYYGGSTSIGRVHKMPNGEFRYSGCCVKLEDMRELKSRRGFPLTMTKEEFKEMADDS